MNAKQFWQIIEECRTKAGSDDRRFLEAVKERLRLLSTDDLGLFQGILNEYIDIAYMPGLWDAAKILNTSCYENDFIDFRAWLISCGKGAYLAALRNPDSIAEIETRGRGKFQDFSYAADMIYRERTGQYFLPDALLTVDNTALDTIHAEIHYGEGLDVLHDDETVIAFIPKLVAKKFGNEDIGPYWNAWHPDASQIVWGSKYDRMRTAQKADCSGMPEEKEERL